jgi:hypothetical protein
MKARNPFSGSNACAFYQELKGQHSLAHRHCHAAEGPFVFLCVGLAALRAPVSLKTIAVLPETATFNFADGAVHLLSPIIRFHDPKIQQAVAVVKQEI